MPITLKASAKGNQGQNFAQCMHAHFSFRCNNEKKSKKDADCSPKLQSGFKKYGAKCFQKYASPCHV